MVKILKINPENPEMDKIREAVRIIKAGGIVVLPTETVYGIVANALDPAAVRRLFKIKSRPLNKPLGIFIENPRKTRQFVKRIPKEAKRLMSDFWPGPLTLIFEKSKKIPDVVTSHKKTLGIRIPDHEVPLQILKAAKIPLVQSSANKTGKKAPISVREVLKQLKDIDLILDSGKTKLGIPSTIIDFSKKKPKVLRSGSIKI